MRIIENAMRNKITVCEIEPGNLFRFGEVIYMRAIGDFPTFQNRVIAVRMSSGTTTSFDMGQYVFPTEGTFVEMP